MQQRTLGQTGLSVSVLGLGTVKLGRNEGVNYPQQFALPSDSQVQRLFAHANELGVNLIDTAPAYGSSEDRIGKLLTNRERWNLCTKVGEGFDNGRSTFDFSPEGIQRSVQHSLARLHTDHLEIVLIHSDGNDIDILDRWGALEVLQDLKQQGLVQAVGISHKTLDGGYRALELGADVLMTTYNDQDHSQLPVIEQATQQKCGVLIKKALSSGHAQDQGSSLRAAANLPGTSSLVVGTLNFEHLSANARALQQ